MNLWPDYIADIRTAQLRSPGHVAIVAIAQAELTVGELYGFDPTTQPACPEAREMACLMFMRAIGSDLPGVEKLDARLAELRASRCQA